MINFQPVRARALLAIVPFLALTACGSSDSADNPDADSPQIVVTYSILGSIVSEVVGSAARVTVLMPNGADPHEWEPSAQDIELLNDADLIVSNGLDLEGNILGPIEEAEKAGVRVFHATDHVEVIEFNESTHHDEDEEGHEDEGGDEEGHEDEGGHEGGDPHFWTSPIAMADVALALEETLEGLGIDTEGRGAMISEKLLSLDQEIQKVLAEIAPESRILVTGHESLGYFADQYDFEIVGTIIPSLSSEAEASAGDLAELKEIIEEEGVSVVFTELGTSPEVAAALASDAGVELVELSTHFLPEDGSYSTFVRELASTISQALAP